MSVNVLEDARATALQDYRKSNGALFQSRDEAEKAAWRDHAIQTIRQHRLAHPDTTPAEDYAEKAAATSMYLSEPDVTPTTTDGSR